MKIRLALAGLLAVGAFAAEETPVPAVPASVTAAGEQVLALPTPGRFREFFLPFRTDTAALSPDGKYIAYSVRNEGKLSVAVIETAHPEKILSAVQVGDDESSTAMMSANQRESTPARITWMRWVTPARIVVETNRVSPRFEADQNTWSSPSGAIIGFDADGSHAQFLLRAKDIPIAPKLGGFSIRRPSLSAPIAGTWRVTDPMATAGAENPLLDPSQAGESQRAFGLAHPVDLTQAPAFADSIQPPETNQGGRVLRVFDLDPVHPGRVNVTLTTDGDESSRRVGFYSVDARTGEPTIADFDFVSNYRSSLLDRAGHIRLTLPNSSLSTFPFRYDYRGPKGAGRDRPLGDTVPGLDFSLSPENFFGRRAIPLGFDADPDVLFFADNSGRDTFGIYSFNLATKQRGHVVMENPAYDLIGAPASAFSLNENLVYDRYTRQLAGIRYDNAMRSTAWVKPELNGLQAYLEKALPGRSVTITDWDEAGRKFLVATESPADAGAFYYFDSEKHQLVEFARRAPWIDAEHTHPTIGFGYTATDGVRLTGLVTVPQQPHLKPIPVLLLCPSWPWQRVNSDFSTEVQALADMGFAVVQLNGRGAWGFGLKQREAITAGYDVAQVEDLSGAIDQLQKVFRINPARVAVLGFGHGGFVALRALQEHPEKFRCAIALDAPVDLATWLRTEEWSNENVQPMLTRSWLGDPARLKAAPLVRHPETLRKPALLLNYPGPEGEARTPTYLSARFYARDVNRAGGSVQFAELTTDYMRGLPRARAEVFGQIEEFLNVNIYDFNVKMRELMVVK